jgi:hypothetical protein
MGRDRLFGPESAVYAHKLATIIQLSISCRVRLRAAQWLCAEAENGRSWQRPRFADHAGEVIAALRGLYAKA